MCRVETDEVSSHSYFENMQSPSFCHHAWNTATPPLYVRSIISCVIFTVRLPLLLCIVSGGRLNPFEVNTQINVSSPPKSSGSEWQIEFSDGLSRNPTQRRSKARQLWLTQHLCEEAFAWAHLLRRIVCSYFTQSGRLSFLLGVCSFHLCNMCLPHKQEGDLEHRD